MSMPDALFAAIIIVVASVLAAVVVRVPAVRPVVAVSVSSEGLLTKTLFRFGISVSASVNARLVAEASQVGSVG